MGISNVIVLDKVNRRASERTPSLLVRSVNV